MQQIEGIERPLASKVELYLQIVRNHVLTPVQSEGVAQSCFATLLLVFAAIDGIGRLLHPDPKAQVNERFKYFLNFLGPDYDDRSDHLWKLRNALVHNGLNVASFLSRVPEFTNEHLRIADGGFILISTPVFVEDFAKALAMLEHDLKTNEALRSQADSRLQWVEVEVPEFSPTTPPPPIEFSYLEVRQA